MTDSVVVPLYSERDTTAVENILQYLSATRGLEYGLLPQSAIDEWNAERKSDWVEDIVRHLVGEEGGGRIEKRIMMREYFWRLKRVLVLMEKDSDPESYNGVREMIRGLLYLLIEEGKVQDEVVKLGAEAICELGWTVVSGVLNEQSQKKGGVSSGKYKSFVKDLFNSEAEEHPVVKKVFGEYSERLLQGMKGRLKRGVFKRKLGEVKRSFAGSQGPIMSLTQFLSRCNMDDVFLLSHEAHPSKARVNRDAEGIAPRPAQDGEIRPQEQSEVSPRLFPENKLQRLTEDREDRTEPTGPPLKRRKMEKRRRGGQDRRKTAKGRNIPAREDDGSEVIVAEKPKKIFQGLGGLERALAAALGTSELPNDPDQSELENDVETKPTRSLETGDVDADSRDGSKSLNGRKNESSIDGQGGERQLAADKLSREDTTEDQEQARNTADREEPERVGIFGKVIGLFSRKSRSSNGTRGEQTVLQDQEVSPTKRESDIQKQLEFESPEGKREQNVADVEKDSLAQAWKELGLGLSTHDEGELETPQSVRRLSRRARKRGSGEGDSFDDLKDTEEIGILPTPKKKWARRHPRNQYFTVEEDEHMYGYLREVGFGDWAGMLRAGQKRGLYQNRTSTDLKDRARTKKWTKDQFRLAKVVGGRGLPPGGLEMRMKLKREAEGSAKARKRTSDEGTGEPSGRDEAQEAS